MTAVIIIAGIAGFFGVISGASLLLAGCSEATFDGSRIGGRSFLIQPICLEQAAPGATAFPAPVVGFGFILLGAVLLFPLVVFIWSSLGRPEVYHTENDTYVETARRLKRDKSIDKISKLYIDAAYKALARMGSLSTEKDSAYWRENLGQVRTAHQDGRDYIRTMRKRWVKKTPLAEKTAAESLWMSYLSQMTGVDQDTLEGLPNAHIFK